MPPQNQHPQNNGRFIPHQPASVPQTASSGHSGHDVQTQYAQSGQAEAYFRKLKKDIIKILVFATIFVVLFIILTVLVIDNYKAQPGTEVNSEMQVTSPGEPWTY